MTQREQIDQLCEEVAELRRQVSALAVAVAQLAVSQPVTQVYYYPAPTQPVWTFPSVWNSPNICGPVAHKPETFVLGPGMPT